MGIDHTDQTDHLSELWTVSAALKQSNYSYRLGVLGETTGCKYMPFNTAALEEPNISTVALGFESHPAISQE